MELNVADSSPKATNASASSEYAFKKLRAHLSPELQHIADDLDAVSRDLETHGAHGATARLRRLDDYATTLPPETLPGLLDSTATFDELEEAAANRYHYARWMAARNILALVPLLITWWSLSAATSAYEAEVQQHPNLVYQPFLILWEHGFNGRIGLTFSAVASLDAILFVMLILGTMVIHLFESAGQREARQLVSRMDLSVTQLVAALGQSRVAFSNNPNDWANAVQRVIAAAMKETRQLAQSGQEVVMAAAAAAKAAAAAAGAASDAVKASHTGVEQIAEQTREYIRQVKSEFAETVKQLHEEHQTFLAGLQRETNERITLSFEEATRQMREQFEANTRQMSDEFKRVAQASLEAVDRAQEAIALVRQESKDTITLVGQELQSAMAQVNVENRQFLADTNRESLATLAAASERADRISEGLSASAKSLQEAIEQHKDGAKALADSMARIGEVTQRFGDNMQTFTNTTATMDAHVQDVALAHERFTQRVETMAAALISAAGETKAATVGMQTTTAQLTDALSQVTAMSSDVTRASQQWAQTQADLPHITQAMRDAANNLRNLRVTVDMSQVPLVGRWFGRKAA